LGRILGWFKGEIADNRMKNKFFNSRDALIDIGIKEEVLNLITQIIEHTKVEKTGYQPLVSGTLLHLLGFVHTVVKQQQFTEENHIEIIVNKARILLRQKIDEDVAMEDIARELNVSYSWHTQAFH